MLKNILSVVGGLVTGIILISLLQRFSHMVYPFPAGTDWTDAEAARLAMQNVPLGALLLVLLAYIAGSFAAGLVAAIIAPAAAKRNAVIVGVILMLAGVMNLVMIPHPGWFWVSLLAYIPMTWLGAEVGARTKKGRD